MKFFAIFAVFFNFLCIYAAEYEIGAQNLKPQKHSDLPQKSFALNRKNIQIKIN